MSLTKVANILFLREFIEGYHQEGKRLTNKLVRAFLHIKGQADPSDEFYSENLPTLVVESVNVISNL